jgi:hypothetical protein
MEGLVRHVDAINLVRIGGQDMRPKQTPQDWNQSVSDHVLALEPIKDWLRRWMRDDDVDWGTQKSAHQALRFLELAEYEMWNMQYWENTKQAALHEDAEKTIL